MKIDTTQELKTLKGENFVTAEGDKLTLGMALAEALGSYQAGGKMKTYVLAHKVWNEPSVEVDAADFELIKKAVEACSSYSNLILGQVLVALETVK